MAYRRFSTNTWQDPWFESLSPKAKLLFIYLWTNEICNQAGIYRISQKRIEFEVGFKIDDVMEELEEKVFWDKERNIVWVKNFFKWQCQNKKFAIAALDSIYDLPEDLKKQFVAYNQKLFEKYGIDKEFIQSRYDIDTVSIQYPYSIDTNPLSETETETEADIYITNDTNVSFPRSCGDNSEASPDVSDSSHLTHRDPPKRDEEDEDRQVFIKIPLIPSHGEYEVTEAEVEEWQKLFPAVDIREELRKIRAWNLANPKRRKTKQGIKRHIVSWLSKEQNRARTPPQNSLPVKSPATEEELREFTEKAKQQLMEAKKRVINLADRSLKKL